MKVLDALSPRGRIGRLQILIYHRVLPEFDELRPDEITAERFKTHLNILTRHFHVLSLPEAYHRLQEGTLPPNAVCITFDDGYKDNFDIALPILKSYNCCASFFIATGFMNNTLMFNDMIIESIRAHHEILTFEEQTYDCSQVSDKTKAIAHLIKTIKPLTLEQRHQALQAYLPKSKALPRLMMHPQEIRALDRAGMHIGAHTVNHPLLSQISSKKALEEIKNSKETLEDLVQKTIDWFAYPNGKWEKDFRDIHVKMLKSLKFTGGLATDWGVATRESHPHKLPRFTPWHRSQFKFLAKMLSMRYLK